MTDAAHATSDRPAVNAYHTWIGQGRPGGLLHLEFSLTQHWLADAPQQSLHVWYGTGANGDWVAVAEAQGAELPVADTVTDWLQARAVPRFELGCALPLDVHREPKPWGQEIWYTGIEERGLSRVGRGEFSVPLPWLLAVLPACDERELVLLKILDPLPEPVRGDLYFELHECKREVYVVTGVDPEAWPDGVGYIRFGFDPAVRAEYSSDDAFLSAYRDAVARYETQRRAIDDNPDAVDEQSLAAEAALREAMDRFAWRRPLAVGDVVKVPLNTPHSLQHGVRTIEFQTPVYERLILSFGQKVLTQDHWDTEAALAVAELGAPEPEAFEVVEKRSGCSVERIVDFEDFEVLRIRLETGEQWPVPALSRYAVGIVVKGDIALDGTTYQPEQACFLPAGWEGSLASAQAASGLVFLLAMPR